MARSVNHSTGKMLTVPMLLVALLAACSAEGLDPCAEARDHVAACSGDEVAAALAETCTDEIAAEVLAAPCDPDDGAGGKADDGTTTLPATLTCGTTSPGFAAIDVGGGVRLHTACQGAGATTIVLLHGWPEYWIAWRDVMADLAPQYRVIAPDLRGYNLSSRPVGQDNYRFDRYLADVVALIERVSDGPVILAGHDVGGFVAWFLAHARPGLVRGLAILDASHPDVLRELLATDPAQRDALQFWNLLDAFQWPLVIGGVFYDQVMETAFAHHSEPRSVLTADEQRLYQEAWRRASVPWRHAMVTMIDGYKANLDFGPAFAAGAPSGIDITAPTLVIWGEHDVALIPEANLAPLPAYVPNLRIERFPDAGHYITHEAPHEVARLLAGLAEDPEGFIQ